MGVAMPDPESVADAEQSWFTWLRRRHEQVMNFLDPWRVNRVLSPEDLSEIVITLDQYVQALNGAVFAASALSRQGALSFAQQLNTEIEDLRTTQALYLQMYDSALAAGAQVARIWRDAGQSTASIMVETAPPQEALSRSIQIFRDSQEGNCFDCHQPIGVTGGGYCAEHARMRGLVVQI
jgi:hypothetical protein